MSMEITNNYSNYAANYVDTVKKPDSKAAAEVKTNTSTNSKDKVRAYYEQLCKKFPQINFNTNGWAQRDGAVLGGRTVTYDANGNRQSSCGGMRTANTGNGNNNTDKIQKKYNEEERLLLKARKKREEKEKIAEKQAEKKAEEEKAAERRAERKEQMEKLTEGTYKVYASGADVKSITQNIVEVVSGTSSPTGGSFDIKA